MSEIKTEIRIPESVNKAIDKIVSPPADVIGKTIASLFNLIFGHLNFLDSKRQMKYKMELAAYEKELEANLKRIPDERRVDPDTQTVLAALEESRICLENHVLRAMFTELITSSVDADRSQLTHPSFASIIRNMSRQDALVLSAISNEKVTPVVNINMEYLNSPGRGATLLKNVCLIMPEVNRKQCALSLISLERHGLITLTYDRYYKLEDLYKPFEHLPEFLAYSNLPDRLEENHPDRAQAVLEKGMLEITELGRMFCETCLPDDLEGINKKAPVDDSDTNKTE
ncbi:MAG: DUF4393 domain-containing protein [Christensenellales bacterium]|jgi:hypothetical protein